MDQSGERRCASFPPARDVAASAVRRPREPFYAPSGMTGLEDLAHCAGNHATDTIFSEVYAPAAAFGGPS
jgi:hypothetical protein